MCIEMFAATLIDGLSALCFDKKKEGKKNGFKTSVMSMLQMLGKFKLTLIYVQ